jgi:hypothetical protein
MIERRGRAGFEKKSAAAIFVCHGVGRKHFERDYATELFVERFIDRSHAARAEHLYHTVMGNNRPLGQEARGLGPRPGKLNRGITIFCLPARHNQ